MAERGNELRETARLDARTEGDVQRAAALLVAGRLVAFPTETVYGLGGRADRDESVRAIFEAKGRPSTNPLIVHVATRDAAAALAEWNDAAEKLARAFWPGPLTLVVRARPGVVARAVTAGGATIGLRVPAHPVALELLREAGVPVAAPSANRSSSVSPTSAAHLLKTLDGRIDAVLDGGASGRGIESTIVDVTRAPAILLRPGAIALEAIAAVVDVEDGGHRLERFDQPARAPGGQARHYAPRARVFLVAAGAVAADVEARRAAGQRVGALELSPGTVTGLPREVLPPTPDAFAAELYAALHRLDDAGVDVVVAAEPPADRSWDAVRDRLRRASS